MPQVGLGTWLSEPGQVGNAVKHVLTELEYLHIDEAMIYCNEKEVGDAMVDVFNNTKLKREDIFVTTKLWNDMHHYDDVITACKDSLEKLQCGYIDLYLVHFPVSFIKGCMEAEKSTEMDNVPLRETWKAMEHLKETGLCKNIGVSNFGVSDIKEILSMPDLKHPPQVNQLEIQPYFQRRDITRFCQQRGMVVTAHTSLGGSANPWSDIHVDRLLEDPTVTEVAKSLGVTNAQVLLRWAIQHGFVVIPKSVNNDRLKVNFELSHFELSEEQMQKLDNLDRGDRGCFNHPVTPWLGRSLFQDEFEALQKEL